MIDELPSYFVKTYSNTPDNVCILDESDNILWLNDSLYNYICSEHAGSKNDIIGQNYFTILKTHLQEDEFILSNIKDGIDYVRKGSSNCYTYEFPYYNLTTALWLMMVACCTTDDETGKSYVVTKLYDITKHHNRRKIENKRDDNNIVNQIIVESMHTWRQPLNSIMLFAQDIKEQFDDNTLTKYYMNFAVKQVQGEVKRLSDSIDEMASFYKNDTDEDTINLSEVMFHAINRINNILMKYNIQVSLNCHALGNVISESFIQLSDSFKIRCGTGAKKCFHGCNKGNVVIYGDKTMFSYIIRMLITLGDTAQDSAPRNVDFELLIEDGMLKIDVSYKFIPVNYTEPLIFVKSLFERYFDGTFDAAEKDGGLNAYLIFNKYKTKQPL